jgi:hypothetical protein
VFTDAMECPATRQILNPSTISRYALVQRRRKRENEASLFLWHRVYLILFRACICVSLKVLSYSLRT